MPVLDKSFFASIRQIKGVAMDFQVGFNVAIALVGMLGGWVLKTVWESVRDLQAADKELTDKVQGIEVLVAGQYIKRDELDRHIEAIFRKLDSIEAKLDRKADK